MNFKKTLAGILLCLLGAIIIGSTSVQAASRKITLKPDTKKETHKSLYVDISISKGDTITKVEVKEGKIKSTANKKWKKSVDCYFYYDEKTGLTDSGFFAYENGYYTVRVTDKNGKKIIKSIKISNMKPSSENSKYSAYITDISKPDSKGDYTVTIDYYAQLYLNPSELTGKRVGDTITVNGKKVQITELKTMDAEDNIVSKKKFDDSIQLVVVMPDKLSDFYDLDKNEYLLDHPESGKFGYIRSISGTFYAYDDYDYWEDGGDYYSSFELPVKKGVELKANKDTNVIPMLNNTENYSISFPEFVKALENSMDENGFLVSLYCANSVYEVYNEKTGKFTKYISEIRQIYTP